MIPVLTNSPLLLLNPFLPSKILTSLKFILSDTIFFGFLALPLIIQWFLRIYRWTFLLTTALVIIFGIQHEQSRFNPHAGFPYLLCPSPKISSSTSLQLLVWSYSEVYTSNCLPFFLTLSVFLYIKYTSFPFSSFYPELPL